MLIYSELATPIDRVDIEPTDRYPGEGIRYHVWERVSYFSLPSVFGLERQLREYRGTVKASDLVWLIFPAGYRIPEP